MTNLCKLALLALSMSLCWCSEARSAVFDKNVADLSQHIKGQPGEARYCVARAAYELADGNTDAAYKDAATGLQDSGGGADHERFSQLALLIMCLCTEKTNNRSSEESLLAQAGGNFSGKNWPFPLIKLFSGKLTEAAIKAPDAQAEVEKQFILGMRKYVKNDRAAGSYFSSVSKAAAPAQSPGRDFALIARALSGGNSLSSTETGGFKTYMNGRYKFALDYPAFFGRGTESENGDGSTFTCPDKKAELRVWGMQLYGTVDGDAWTIAKLIAEQTKYYQSDSEPPGRVTYKASGKDFLVLSGLKDGKIFYYRALLAADGVKCFEIIYPQSAKESFDSVVSRLAHSLRNTR